MDKGPFVDDFFWILSGKDQGCVVQIESDDMQELLARLQKFGVQ